MFTRSLLLSAALVLGLAASPLSADTLQLQNGDVITGKVVAVTDKEVTLESDVLGKVTLPREKVLAIVLGERRIAADDGAAAGGQPAGEGAAEPQGEKPVDIVKRLVNKDFGPEQVKGLSAAGPPVDRPEGAVEQLRREGVDPRLMNELRVQLPGFNSPPVQKYFNERVDGLIDGSVTLGDIRKEAVDVRGQLLELKQFLGKDGEVLNGYLGILDSFIDETESLPPVPAAALPPEPPAVESE